METIESKNCVLDEAAIGRKIKRMALEVAERNSDEEELVIAGITGNGEVLARSLSAELGRLCSIRLEMITIQLNKKEPADVNIQPATPLKGRTVIVVDDVANTGRTMLYAFKPLLDLHPRKLQTLVLVERSHKLFPVQTDYAGLSITTTLQEHIAVETAGERLTAAWLY